MQPGIENQELISLKEQIAQINNITVFELFIDRAAKLFPLAYGKLKPQLEEIKNLKTKLEDSSVHIAEDYTLPAHNYPEIVGTGLEMRKVFALIDQVANSESTVLIFGETGTGKELIARAIHNNSARRGNDMIKINCAAIPANLIESELFGHEKGAFTGATDKRIGKFELANNSTLFLDEIGELPLDMQVKLLRALQEKEIERVGGKTVIKTNVRVISATNRNLLAEVAKGRFRQDLYFRLNVFPISLPPLRERAEDLPLLASYFLAKYAGKTGKKLTGFTKGAIKQMAKYNWPGNVRELEHLIERQVLLAKQPIINKIDLPVNEKTITDNNGVTQKIKTIDENERDHIFEVLRICKGKVSGTDGAAKLLGVPATTLNSKMKRLGLSKKHF
nr:sigma-54 dependent transcriptional regulator [Mucilaginibacter sp. UR6-1]